jgi:hypothetical protein
VDPGWDAVRVVRLAPSEGPSAGNRAHLTLDEVIAAVRRGESGPGWHVPADEPPSLDPQAMLGALREDPNVRDRRLVRLAQEVAEERERLVEERAALAEERAILAAQAARQPRPRPVDTAPADPVAVPRTAAEAAGLLGVAAGASAAEVERAYREQVTRCHPDRVAGLHPSIRGRAEGLTVALNAARDLLLGRVPRRQRASG